MPNYVIDRLASGEPEEACNEFDGVVNKAEDTPEPPNKIGGAAVSSLLDIMLPDAELGLHQLSRPTPAA